MGGGHDTVEISQAIATQFGLYSAVDGGHLFCGQNDQGFAINGVTYQWPRGSQLTLGVDFSRLGGLSDMDCKDLMVAANREISDCCDVGLSIITSPQRANIKLQLRRLDGPSGVLAQCGIPVGNLTAERGQLNMEFDDSETWVAAVNPSVGKIDFYRVYLHELLHGLGLGHKPANIAAPALIAPMYSPRIRNLQAADVQELQRRYGPAKVDPVGPAPTPVPAPAGDKLEVEELRIRCGGKRYKLSGSVGALPLILDE
jgi:hypothetical protein